MRKTIMSTMSHDHFISHFRLLVQFALSASAVSHYNLCGLIVNEPFVWQAPV
jgi:hypothetical protein